MTLHHIIVFAGKFAIIYGLWLCLLGFTFILMDLFMDWYAEFKQTLKDKAAKNKQGGDAN